MTSIYEHSPLLPEIVHLIATLSPITWTQIATAIPDFGRYSMTDAGRREFVRLFIQLHRGRLYRSHFAAVICDGLCRSVYG